MSRLPGFPKRLLDLLPSPANLARLLTGTALVSAGVGAATTSEPIPAVPTIPAPTGLQEQARRLPRLVLRLATGMGSLPIAHRSHSSHRSHRSHASHYSSSTAPRYVAPPPAATADPAPDPASESKVLVTITAIDKDRRTLSGKDEFGTSYEFQYRDDTLVKGRNGMVRLDEWLDAGNALPFSLRQKVDVEWKPSSDHQRRMAVRVAPK